MTTSSIQRERHWTANLLATSFSSALRLVSLFGVILLYVTLILVSTRCNAPQLRAATEHAPHCRRRRLPDTRAIAIHDIVLGHRP